MTIDDLMRRTDAHKLALNNYIQNNERIIQVLNEAADAISKAINNGEFITSIKFKTPIFKEIEIIMEKLNNLGYSVSNSVVDTQHHIYYDICSMSDKHITTNTYQITISWR